MALTMRVDKVVGVSGHWGRLECANDLELYICPKVVEGEVERSRKRRRTTKRNGRSTSRQSRTPTHREDDEDDDAGASQTGKPAEARRNEKGNNNRPSVRYMVWTIGYGVTPYTKSETETSSRRVICKASIASWSFSLGEGTGAFGQEEKVDTKRKGKEEKKRRRRRVKVRLAGLG